MSRINFYLIIQIIIFALSNNSEAQGLQSIIEVDDYTLNKEVNYSICTRLKGKSEISNLSICNKFNYWTDKLGMKVLSYEIVKINKIKVIFAVVKDDEIKKVGVFNFRSNKLFFYYFKDTQKRNRSEALKALSKMLNITESKGLKKNYKKTLNEGISQPFSMLYRASK